MEKAKRYKQLKLITNIKKADFSAFFNALLNKYSYNGIMF